MPTSTCKQSDQGQDAPSKGEVAHPTEKVVEKTEDSCEGSAGPEPGQVYKHREGLL